MAAIGRLPRGRDFELVFSEGTVFGGPLVVVRVRPGATPHARWGFAVGKRLDKRAVVRNRVRRRLKEAAAALEVLPSLDIVVTARKRALDATYKELRADLTRALAQAGANAEDTPR